MEQATTALIEEHVRHVLTVMGFSDVTVHCSRAAEDDVLRIDINAGDGGKFLIGSNGTHLFALQHVVRCLLRKSMVADTRVVVVDVNGYRARRERGLLDLAQEVARRAHKTGKTVALQPMTAADRRAIHTALAEHKDINTESLGEEPNRRVVVRPVFL